MKESFYKALYKQRYSKGGKIFNLKKEYKYKRDSLPEKGRKDYNRSTKSSLKKLISLKELLKSKTSTKSKKSFCVETHGIKKKLKKWER